MTIEAAFGFGLSLKERTLSPTTLRSYKNRIVRFKTWLKENKPTLKYIDEIDKSIVTTFLNEVLSKTSARNRNNFRIDLSSIIQVLHDNDIVKTNYVKRISVLKTNPKRHKTFNQKQEKEIIDYLEQEDPNLLLFIKFIAYNLLRPIEVCRLKVGDLNMEQNLIQFKAKNSALKTKIIPEILQESLPDLSGLAKDFDLFTPEGIGGQWNTLPVNKRDYYSKRFKKVVKDKFGLGIEYGLYSFRHTYITKIFQQLEKTYSPNEAKSRLMQITGHNSMASLEAYLRNIDAALPGDYTNLINDANKDL